MATFRQKVLSRRPRCFSSSPVAETPRMPATRPAAAQPPAAVAAGPWLACLEQAEGAAAQQRPYVVMRHDLPAGPECLKGQGGRKRRFGSLPAAEAAAAEANQALV